MKVATILVLAVVFVAGMYAHVAASSSGDVASSGGNLLMLDAEEKIFVMAGTNPEGVEHYLSLWKYDDQNKKLLILGTAFIDDDSTRPNRARQIKPAWRPALEGSN